MNLFLYTALVAVYKIHNPTVNQNKSPSSLPYKIISEKASLRGQKCLGSYLSKYMYIHK